MRFLRSLYEQDYDLVVLTGDIFEDYSGLGYASSLLVKQPRLGAYAVFGNHDYYEYNMFAKTLGRVHPRFHPRRKRNVKPMVDALKHAGFTVLRNECHTLYDHGIHVVGIDYPGINERSPAGAGVQGSERSFCSCPVSPASEPGIYQSGWCAPCRRWAYAWRANMSAGNRCVIHRFAS